MMPSDWKQGTIEDIATVSSGGTPNRANDSYWKDGLIPWVTTAEVKFGTITDTEQKITEEGLNNSSAKLFPKDTILMAMYGQGKTRGQVAKLGIEASTNQACAALQLHDGFEVDYYYQYLISQYENIRSLANSGGQKNLSGGIIKGINIPIPPLLEQQKIAEILFSWDKAISTTERLIDNSTQQKKALMQQLLTGKKRLLDESGERFEGEWEEFKLSNWLVEYKEKSTIKDQYDVYTSSRNGLVLQSVYFANSRIAERDNIGFHVIPPNHITYRSRSDDGFFTFNLFSGDKNGLISHYYPVFSTKGSNKFFIALFEQYRATFGRYSVGTSQRVLSLNALKDILFKIPSIQEQQKIATVLTNADQEIELLEQQLNDLQQEKKALMQQLLTGKRRVKVEVEQSECV